MASGARPARQGQGGRSGSPGPFLQVRVSVSWFVDDKETSRGSCKLFEDMRPRRVAPTPESESGASAVQVDKEGSVRAAVPPSPSPAPGPSHRPGEGETLGQAAVSPPPGARPVLGPEDCGLQETRPPWWPTPPGLSDPGQLQWPPPGPVATLARTVQPLPNQLICSRVPSRLGPPVTLGPVRVLCLAPEPVGNVRQRKGQPNGPLNRTGSEVGPFLVSPRGRGERQDPSAPWGAVPPSSRSDVILCWTEAFPAPASLPGSTGLVWGSEPSWAPCPHLHPPACPRACVIISARKGSGRAVNCCFFFTSSPDPYRSGRRGERGRPGSASAL